MFRKSLPLKRSAIGIDVGDHAVKCVQLERHRDQLRVCDIRCVEVEGGAADRTDHRQRILEAAQRALRAGDFHGSRCLSALRLFETTTRHVRIPVSEMERAREVLVRELRENEHEAAPDFSFQYLPVAELMDRGKRQCEYLCCIADPLIIREHLDLLASLHLQPVAIDLDSVAQVRPFMEQNGDDDGPIDLSIDLGCRCSRLIVVRGSRPILVRTVPVGGADFQRTLEQKLQIDFQAARDLAEANRLGDSEDLQDLRVAISGTLSEHLDLIVSRVAECTRYTATLFGGRPVESLRVLGGAAALPGIVEYLVRNLRIPIAESDPFRALGVESPRVSRCVAPATFATAVGLAMRGLAA